VAKNILCAETDVERAVERVRRCAEPKAKPRLAPTETELWTALLELGRAVITLFFARCGTRPRATSYEHEGVQYVLDTKVVRRGKIGTRFGKVPFIRGVGRPVGGRQRVDLPIDRELGLCSSFSLGTVTALVQLCALMAFGTARRMFTTFHGWAPSSRSTLRMVDELGRQARGFLDDAAVPEEDGEVLVIQVDARGAPMISSTEYERRSRPHQPTIGTKRHGRRILRRRHERPRRNKGDKSKNSKSAFVGVLYTLRKTPDGWEGPINKRLIATFESHDALFRWLHEHARRRGYGRKRTLFLADGFPAIWDRYERYFPKAVPCIDWFHVVEKLWEAGTCLYAEGSKELRAWVHEQKQLLRHGRLTQLHRRLTAALEKIPKTGPGNKGRRKRLDSTLKYLAKHKSRMRYAELRREDLDIGTGAVEGAVRNLIGIRLDGPGMRWGRARSEMVLHLRCVLLNGQWDDFCAHLRKRPIKLAAQPIPATTFDAKRREAA